MGKRTSQITADDKTQGFTARELRAALDGVPDDAEVRATVTLRGRIKTLTVESDDAAPVRTPPRPETP